MMYTTLISVSELQALQHANAKLCIVDCSYDLMASEKGHAQFTEQHIAHAQYADLNLNLSTHDDALRVNGGRHPLPNREHFAQWLQSIGISQDTQVVVYDRNSTSFCGRLWWMLKWCGHEAVAVLDGGLAAWVAAGGTLASGDAEFVVKGDFSLRASLVTLVQTSEVAAKLGTSQTIIDARATPRYRGEVEPLDPVAGHIPGALNRPFNLNFTADGLMKPAAQLREEFEALLNGRDSSSVVQHCGSGVTATPNVLAMYVAGLGMSALYAGSWSEWCNTAGMPLERG
jgi:thiosulfate/3-mercaptopyruvate sulfurtransferase